ncbi:L-threonylcarbamoyladenylate synthase [Proteinivorax tanatarense]|uniref:Threonylcarbamoyl-AMP synthase n=1 Tax=Proteinivorax tanatarense TaxID=1260629 RepID=A0AAU7VLE2_9FIRM
MTYNTNTKILKNNNRDIGFAAQSLKDGKTVVFPTETVYGLGAHALDTNAVEKIFKAKGRPADNPLIIHVPCINWLRKLAVNIPKCADKLGHNFWPGPLTLILLANKETVPSTVRGGLETVAIRIPSHSIARRILEEADIPIAAPSANRSGRPSPTSFHHAYKDLNGRVDCIVDGGRTDMGLESTVLDLTSPKPVILRPGLITQKQIKSVVDAEGHKEYVGGKVLSPGTKYKHYSPRAPMTLFVGEYSNVVKVLQNKVKQEKNIGKKIGVLAFEEYTHHFRNVDKLISMGSLNSTLDIAAGLYKNLHDMDYSDVDVILAMGLGGKDDLSYAVMNRLLKACGHNIVQV